MLHAEFDSNLDDPSTHDWSGLTIKDWCYRYSNHNPPIRHINVSRTAGNIADGVAIMALMVAVAAADSEPLAILLLLSPFALTYLIARRIERKYTKSGAIAYRLPRP